MESTEQNVSSLQEPQSNFKDEVKQFYNSDFKNIFFTFFKNPIDGIYSLLKSPSENAYKQSLILFP
jgi:hypothetical protein